MQGTQFNKLVSNLYENMKQTLRKQEGHNLLKEYSPWLDCFQSMDYSQTIEVPGQMPIHVVIMYTCTVWSPSFIFTVEPLINDTKDISATRDTFLVPF